LGTIKPFSHELMKIKEKGKKNFKDFAIEKMNFSIRK